MSLITQSWNYDKDTKIVSWDFKIACHKDAVSGTFTEGDEFVLQSWIHNRTKTTTYRKGKILTIKPKTIVYQDDNGKIITKRTDTFIRIISSPKIFFPDEN